MGLLDRIRGRDQAVALPAVKDPYQLDRYFQRPQQFVRAGRAARPEGFATRVATFGYYNANDARRSVLANNGAEEDLASIKDSLDSLYQIADKLAEVDATLLEASSRELYSVLQSDSPGSSPEEVDKLAAQIEQAVSSWVVGVSGEAKRRWFEQLLSVRRDIVTSLLEGYKNIHAMSRDLAFLQAATKAQGLLPEFAIQDAKSELLTTGNAADKARVLAESVAELEAPALSALEEAPGLPVAAPELEPGIQR